MTIDENYSINPETKKEFKSNVSQIYQVELHKDILYISPNFHNCQSITKDNNIIESWNINTGKKENGYLGECNKYYS